jgi:tetratricopeptide (TPR) repeat protein
MRKAFIGLCLFAIVVGMACKTTRRKDEVSKLGKFYHNTTAKYNGYFNANVLIEESLENLANSFEDNYNQLIPVYKWHGAPEVEGQFTKLDTAIKKVSVVASLHEPSVWTDDCYLLAGKAHYIKQDYEQAQKTLEYTINEFDPSNPSSRFWEYRQDEIRKKQRKKKKEERKERQELKEEKVKERKRSRRQEIRERKRQKRRNTRGRKKKQKEEKKEETKKEESQELEENPLYEPTFNEKDYTKGGHEPAFKEAQLWLARTYVERDRFSNALNLLRKLANDATLDKDVKERVYATMGELFIAEREYNRAITYLEKALNVGNNRQQNSRYAYLMAQLYQLGENALQASKYYAEAARLSSNYEMEFSAKLEEIKNSFYSGEMSKEKTFDRLENELEDGKNTEYIDQIYYAMAQIARESGDKALAQEYLSQALRNSTGNNAIALEAYYSLGEYHFELDEFQEAKLYYDSAMLFMPKTDPRFIQSTKRHKNLTKLDEQLIVLTENDSALILAEMSPEERQLLVQEKIEKQRAKEERKEARKEADNKQVFASAGDSDFFAYDPRKVRDGKAEFNLVWEDRPLIDDWRRTTKLRLETGGRSPDTINETALEDIPSAAEQEKILGNYPKTESEIAATKQQIVKALYELGVIYHERLERPDLAVEVLTQLVERFPRSTKDIESLYLLVLSYRELDDRRNEEKYTELLLDRYPNSKYARIVQDPSYVDHLQKEAQKVEDKYQQAYNEFHSANYASTIQLAQQAYKSFSTEEAYMPKFKLLEAMAKGKVAGKDTYINELRDLIKTYERSPEAVRAREIIRFLNGSENAFTQKEGQMGDFKTDDDKLHYVIAVMYNSGDIDMTNAKLSVSDFNKKYFKLKGLVPSTIYLDLNRGIPLIIVRNFDNKKDAMRYYQTAKQYAEEFLPEKARYDLFAVTQRNYRVILKQRTIESYRPFFEQYYLRSEESN